MPGRSKHFLLTDRTRRVILVTIACHDRGECQNRQNVIICDTILFHGHYNFDQYVSLAHAYAYKTGCGNYVYLLTFFKIFN